MSGEKVTAQTYWVWTDVAAAKNPSRSVSGVPVWPHYQKDAPKEWLNQGLIIDASEYVEEGQTTIFDFM